MGRVFIGTSGWVYPHWRGRFYPENIPDGGWLEFYAKNFSAVELNASFYHLPGEKTFRSWYERTPKDFVFAIKGSRFITHVKRLRDCQEPLANLLQSVSGLEEKLGPIFFQLPPSFESDKERLGDFIRLLPIGKRFAFEFRHPSWFNKEVCALLQKANCALVASDTPDYPYGEIQTANFMYFRLHGHEQLYASSYTRMQLKEYAERMRQYLRRGDVFVFFDNDANANAVENAKGLAKLVE